MPYHSELNLGNTAASGIMGSWHTERGLTFCTVDLSGHMVCQITQCRAQNLTDGKQIPQYQPSAAYRQLEFLLGRIDNLGEQSDFSTQMGEFGN